MSIALTESSFWILSSLAAGRRHGYGILQDVAALSEGSTALKVPTLYAALDRLENAGFIIADGEEVVDGRVRRYFALTDAGSVALDAEAGRLADRARVARERLTARRPPISSSRPATARAASA